MRLTHLLVIQLFALSLACAGEAGKANTSDAARPPKVATEPLSGKPTLKGAEITLHTTGGDKRIDTCVFVTVETKDGTVLARVSDAACSELNDKVRLRYTKNSDHALGLDVIDWGEQADKCKGFRVKIWQVPAAATRSATWEFDAKLILRFADGSMLTDEKTGIKLVDRGESATSAFSNSD